MAHDWKEGDTARRTVGVTSDNRRWTGREFTVDGVCENTLIDKKGFHHLKSHCEYVPPKPSGHKWKVGDRAELAVPIRNPKHFVPSGYRFNVVEVCRDYVSDGIYWHKISHCKLPSEHTPEIDAKIEAACGAIRAEFAAKLTEIAKPKPSEHEWSAGDTARRKCSMRFPAGLKNSLSGFMFPVVEVSKKSLFDGEYWHDKTDCTFIPPENTDITLADLVGLINGIREEMNERCPVKADTKPEPASEPVVWAVGDIAMIAFDGYCFEVFGVEGPNLFTKTKVRFRKRSCVQLYSTKCGTLSETIQHIKEAIK